MQPYEIVCAPYTVYQAPVGTAMPALNASPAAPWVVWGTSGNLNYTEDGVTVNHGQTVNTFTPAGGTMPRKAWRTEEMLTVTFTLADMSPTQYAMAMDNATLATVTATASGADLHFELYRGVNVKQAATLIRGISPANEALTAQYELPNTYQSGSPSPTFSKQNPAEMAIEITAFQVTQGTIGTLRVQTG